MMPPTAGRQPTTCLSTGQSPTRHSTMRLSPGEQGWYPTASSACRTATCLMIAPLVQTISDTPKTGNHPPDVGQSGLRLLKFAACLTSQGGTSATSNSAGMHTFWPVQPATPSVWVWLAPVALYQVNLAYRQGEGNVRLAGSCSCTSSSHAKLILSPSLLILIWLLCLCTSIFQLHSSKPFHLSLLQVLCHFAW